MMKTILVNLILMICAQISFAQSTTFDLNIQIDGIIQGKGNIEISLFNSEDSFMKTPVKKLVKDLEQYNENSFLIKDVTPGTYAITVVQDENRNGELDMGMMGPTENYGFSNDARGMFGPPDYEEALILLESGKKVLITIK